MNLHNFDTTTLFVQKVYNSCEVFLQFHLFSPFKRSGIAWELLHRILLSTVAKHAKVHVRQCGAKPQRLVMGIGQIHPVLRGTFERFQARRIAAIQYWIFCFCKHLAEQEGIHCFGKEGFTSPNGKRVRARLPLKLLQAMRREYEAVGTTQLVFKRAAQQWRTSLQKNHVEQAHEAMRFLDALSSLQAHNNQVTIFPLEQTGVHSAINQKIDSLQNEISAIERSATFRSATSKSGKGLSQKEIHIFLKRNKLVRSFNQLLSDPQRDQVIFENVMTHAASEPVTVFVLGHGHRDRFLRLAKRHMPSDTLFVWITPPHLWRWKTLLHRSCWVILCLVVVALTLLSW